MKGKGFALVAAGAALFAAAVSAFAGVGDVIGSFKMDNALNVYRNADYVYCVVGRDTLRRYTVNGSLVGTVALAGLSIAGDADHSPLGPGYLGVIAGMDRVLHYRVSNGSLVTSVPTRPATLGYAYFPGGTYLYVQASACVYRYKTTGSLVSSFTVGYSSTAIAATDRFDDKAGDYVIVASRSPTSMVFTGAGSFVRSFDLPGPPLGCVCGPGSLYPLKTPFTTYWCVLPVGPGRFAYEIDLGNRNVGVKAASFGKVKGLYR
ncbi:MAG: hypothetical protein GTN49_07510 [candidate division Zixibacteria bacterium]|nr:hypothetical protein [candidate division Zixibacteria bacterium]